MKREKIVPVLLSTALISLLFHKQYLGINLLLFELCLFAGLFWLGAIDLKQPKQIVYFAGAVFTAFFTIFTHSLFSYIMHFIAFFIFIGILIYPQAKSLLTTAALSFTSLFLSQAAFFKNISGVKVQGQNVGGHFKKGLYFVIPLIVILFFIVIYRLANPVFTQLTNTIGMQLNDWFLAIFRDFDFSILFTITIGLFISNFIIYRKIKQAIANSDLQSSEKIERIRKKKPYKNKFMALKIEHTSAIFLLFILNFILVVVNVIDIHWVWFGFEWEGQYLKQFVHEGTYLLILSILVSILIVLFFFRGNLNFYSKNRILKYLSYMWLAQNAVLAVSVAIRNFWYIHYFALAYKRIGVIIFLILVLIGLYTVLIKVLRRKSVFYLLKTNAFALYLTLIISSGINWDMFIARYNFRHSDTSFLHLDFMVKLSDKVLPQLDIPHSVMLKINEKQLRLFPFEKQYMGPLEYHQVIQERKMKFKKRWESKNILSWNLPEYVAYKRLFAEK